MSGEYTFNGFFIYYDAVCKHTPTTRPSGWYYYMKRWVLNPFLSHCIKSVHIRSFSDPHFPAFGLNTERYFVSLRSFRILPECWKKNPEKLRIRTLFTHCLFQFILVYLIDEKKNRWKVANFLVVTNIFPRPIILPD